MKIINIILFLQCKIWLFLANYISQNFQDSSSSWGNVLGPEVSKYVDAGGNMVVNAANQGGSGAYVEGEVHGHYGHQDVKIDRHTQIHMEEDIHKESQKMFRQETRANTLMV